MLEVIAKRQENKQQAQSCFLLLKRGVMSFVVKHGHESHGDITAVGQKTLTPATTQIKTSQALLSSALDQQLRKSVRNL